jgi:hypothetical protein
MMLTKLEALPIQPSLTRAPPIMPNELPIRVHFVIYSYVEKREKIKASY